MRRWLWLLLAMAGCTVPPLDDAKSKPTRNECGSNADCGAGRCQSGACVASRGTFSTVLFEVTPPTSSSNLSGIRFLKRVDGLPPNGGRQDLLLDDVVRVSGSVVASVIGVQKDCAWDQEISVSLTPADQLLGLSSTQYWTTGRWVKNGEYAFEISVPGGEYDIYVQPHSAMQGDPGSLPNPSCLVSQFRRRVVVEPSLRLDIPAPSKLTLYLVSPDEGLAGTTADIIEPNTLRVISTERKLVDCPVAPPLNPKCEEYGAKKYVELFYLPVVGAPTNELGTEVVRLRPPEGATVLAPTIHLQRSALELFKQGEGVIDQFKTLPPVIVDAQVVNGLAPIAGAAVTISASEIDAPDALDKGTIAQFSVAAESGIDGRFQAQLFPGTYWVVVVPPAESGLATLKSELKVAKTPDYQAAQTFELLPAITVHGRVLDPAGAKPVVGAAVQAIVSPASLAITAIYRADGDLPITPRATTSVLNQKGIFLIGADPGTYDVAVRPEEGTGFAWLVRPGVTVGQPELASDPVLTTAALGDMTLPLPVLYNGRVTTPAVSTDETPEPAPAPVPGALIRAYLYMSDTGYTTDLSAAISVLQIAETRAAADGSFELLLPAELNGSVPTQAPAH